MFVTLYYSLSPLISNSSQLFLQIISESLELSPSISLHLHCNPLGESRFVSCLNTNSFLRDLSASHPNLCNYYNFSLTTREIIIQNESDLVLPYFKPSIVVSNSLIVKD